MGMCYEYAGSASYPRFDRELCGVASVFGGVKTEHLKEQENTEEERPFGYWFGFVSSDNSGKLKFAFPDETNEILVKWFENIYDYFSPSETAIIWEQVSAHPEIEKISSQIWDELECLTKYGEGWKIT